MSRGNFIATILIKGNSLLQKHLLSAKGNAKSPSKKLKIRLFISMCAKSEEYLLDNSERIAYLSPS